MSPFESPKAKKKLIQWMTVLAVLTLVILLLANLSKINAFIESIFSLVRPILWGLCLAYLLNPFFRLFEKKLFVHLRPMSLRRGLALLCSYVAFFLIVLLIVLLIVPQLYISIANFLSNYDVYAQSAVGFINSLTSKINTFLSNVGATQLLIPEIHPESMQMSNIFLNIDQILIWVQGLLGGEEFSLVDTLGGLLGGITDGIFAFFISLYFLLSKEQRYAQVMKARRALFSDKTNATLTRFFTTIHRSFGEFFEGKLIGALIIGFLSFIPMAIIKIPHFTLLATILGVMSMIPYIGIFIGAIPCALILLLVNATMIIPFSIVVLAVQILDSNIITPKLLGNNTGISALCVLIALSTMGNLFGVIGLLLAVPVFATVVALTNAHTENKLRAMGLESATENYYSPDSLVDPARDVRRGNDKLVKKLERAILRVREKEENGTALSASDKRVRSFYRFLRRLGAIPEISDETQVQFATERSADLAEENAVRMIKERNGMTLVEKVTETERNNL
jgi:predicted PurR-regulated permease PerM